MVSSLLSLRTAGFHVPACGRTLSTVCGEVLLSRL